MNFQWFNTRNSAEAKQIIDAAEIGHFICIVYTMAESVEYLQEPIVKKILEFCRLQINDVILCPDETVVAKQLLYRKLLEMIPVLRSLFEKFTFNKNIVEKAAVLSIDTLFETDICRLHCACLDFLTMVSQYFNLSTQSVDTGSKCKQKYFRIFNSFCKANGI